jgi:hypothetical protein
LGHAAGGAGFFHGLGFYTGTLAESQKHICELESGGIGHSFFLGAVFTQIDLLHVSLHDLREEDRGRFIVADIAFHWGEAEKRGWNGLELPWKIRRHVPGERRIFSDRGAVEFPDGLHVDRI